MNKNPVPWSGSDQSIRHLPLSLLSEATFVRRRIEAYRRPTALRYAPVSGLRLVVPHLRIFFRRIGLDGRNTELAIKEQELIV